ncbi:MAG: lipopolysaccharide heptosyltransferase [Planctomycetaceae bacterium]|nr:lipopolysaccharide heptosyltransferase [Planctomycetaceae bacterium]
MKIALFLPNWVGDLVMATPAMRAVRDQFPDAEITAILRPQVADVLSGMELVDRQLRHDPKGSHPGHRGLSFVQKLRAEQFDVAVLFPNSFRSGWLAWVSGAKRRIGFARNGRGWMLTDALKPSSRTTPQPVLDEYLKLVAPLGCDTSSRDMELATTPHDEFRLDRFWWKQAYLSEQYGSGQNYVCLNSGGAFGAAKHWPTEYFGQLAKQIAGKLERRVLVLCGPAEREIARKIVDVADHPAVVSLAEEDLSLGLTKAAIRRADLLVTTDSGPRHFAQPFDVPVITLFGPTHQAWSETHNPLAVHLQIPVDCGPCQERTCPLQHHRCMRDLSVETVFRTVRQQLDVAMPVGLREAA